MFLVSLSFPYLTLKLFLKRAEIFAHLKMSYVMITSRNIKRNMRIIPSRLLKILYAICLSFLRVKNLNRNGRNNHLSAIVHFQALFISTALVFRGVNYFNFYSEHVLSAPFIGWVIHNLLFYAFSSHFCFLI